MNGVVQTTDYFSPNPNLTEHIRELVKTPKLRIIVVVPKGVSGYMAVLMTELRTPCVMRHNRLNLPNGCIITVVGENFMEAVRGIQADVVLVRPDAEASVLNMVIPCLIASKMKRLMYYQ
jgi:hypothetical protein